MLNKTEFKERAASTLQRLAVMNAPTAHGPGMQPDHFVPLCKYHNRSVARKLSRLLAENSVRVEVRTTRMYTFISVCIENHSTATSILKQFAESNLDTRVKTFSRDYDAAILIGLVTVICAALSFFVPIFSRMLPVAILISGVSLAIIAEGWHRTYRYRTGRQFSLAEIMSLTALIAMNIAIWRFAF